MNDGTDGTGGASGQAETVERQAADIERLQGEIERLRLALEHRAVIEQAKGMVARDHGVSVEVAFEWLRRHSRNTNTPVRVLASAVVDLGLHIPRPLAEPRRVIAVQQRRQRVGDSPPSRR
jgi:hypothetical protein